MSTSFIDRRLLALTLSAGLLGLAGCASNPMDTGLESSGEKLVSKYAEDREKKSADVGVSDAVHIPPVPHDPAVEGMAAKAMPAYAAALKSIKSGNLDQALTQLQAISAEYPQLSGPLVNQGKIYIAKEDYKQAQAALEQALKANAQNPYAHNLLGLTLRQQGQFEQARQHYETALQLDPMYARAHFNLGVLAELYMQDFNLALSHFQAYQSLQKEPDQTVANWIADLERRVPAPVAPAAIAAPDAVSNNQEVN